MTDLHDVEASEYLDYRDRVGPRRQLWENNGWSVRGRDDGTDYLLWTSPYLIRGLGGDQSYRAGDIAVSQTLLITHDADAPNELTDNDFIAVGWDPDEYLSWDDVEVSTANETVSWATGGRTMSAAPPAWSIGGSHAGVDVDLSIRAITAPQWFTDPADGFDVRTDRWWIANGDAAGSIRTPATTIAVNGAHAVHERHIHCGLAHDPVTLLGGEGIVWFTVSGPEVTGYVMARPSRGASWAQFEIAGRTIEVTDGGISCTTVRSWQDPATGMVVGQTWRIVVEHSTGTLTLNIQAKARAYYSWDFLSQGSTILYWWLGVADATIVDDRGTRTVRDLASECHLNRTFYTRHGSARG